MKRGKFCPASDFKFELVAEVICSEPFSSGYLINLTPAGSDDTRYVLIPFTTPHEYRLVYCTLQVHCFPLLPLTAGFCGKL